MNTDEKSLDAASEIMQLLGKDYPYAQLKAMIQCIIIKLLEEKV